MTKDGVDLVTVVMHELGHLLGYDHSDDPHDLMAPVLNASQSRTARSLDLPNLSPNLSPKPAQPQKQPSLLENAADLFAALALDDDKETGRTRISRRSRIERYERELDAWFAQLGEDSQPASAAGEIDRQAARR
jgi:hypothetical protein